MPTNTNAGQDRVITEADRLSDVVTKACADNLVEAQEATSLMNFTVRCLEQRLKDAVCEVDEYRRAIVDLEAKIKRLEEALRRIANQDYRGNRSTESQIAAEALKEAKP